MPGLLRHHPDENPKGRLASGWAVQLAGMAGSCEHGYCRWRCWDLRSQAVVERFVRRYRRSEPHVAARLASKKPAIPGKPAIDADQAARLMS